MFTPFCRQSLLEVLTSAQVGIKTLVSKVCVRDMSADETRGSFLKYRSLGASACVLYCEAD